MKRLAKIEGDKLVIEIEIGTLKYALQYYNDQHSLWRDEEPLELIDELAFAKDIVVALEQEEEDGTTLIHEMMDKALEYAIEMGSEGIAWK